MEPWTALIADPCEEITLALAQVLQPHFRVLCCADGQEALHLLDRESPDIFITELSLPRMDGIALLRELSRREIRPRVLVHTIIATDYVVSALRELPVDYILRKPTPVHMVAERARELLSPRQAPGVDWCVADLLIRLGIPETCQGFRHLVVALPLLAEQSEQFLGKTLYLQIAQRNRVSTESVEKAIRDAIHSGWDRGNRALWQSYFPGITRAPQNKQFLTRMAGLLLRLRRCG